MSKWKFVIQDLELVRYLSRYREISMKAWIDKNYRSFMLYAMVLELALLSVLVVVEIVVAMRPH